MNTPNTVTELSADEVLLVSGGLRNKDECIENGGAPTLVLGGFVCDY